MSQAPRQVRGVVMENDELERKLDQRVPKIEFADIPLQDVVHCLRGLSGLNVHVKWRALQIAGIDRTTAVNLQLQDVKIRTVLDVILQDVGVVTPLVGVIEDGVLTITTADDAEGISGGSRIVDAPRRPVEPGDVARDEQRACGDHGAKGGSSVQEYGGHGDVDDPNAWTGGAVARWLEWLDRALGLLARWRQLVEGCKLWEMVKGEECPGEEVGWAAPERRASRARDGLPASEVTHKLYTEDRDYWTVLGALKAHLGGFDAIAQEIYELCPGVYETAEILLVRTQKLI